MIKPMNTFFPNIRVLSSICAVIFLTIVLLTTTSNAVAQDEDINSGCLTISEVRGPSSPISRFDQEDENFFTCTVTTNKIHTEYITCNLMVGDEEIILNTKSDGQEQGACPSDQERLFEWEDNGETVKITFQCFLPNEIDIDDDVRLVGSVKRGYKEFGENCTAQSVVSDTLRIESSSRGEGDDDTSEDYETVYKTLYAIFEGTGLDLGDDDEDEETDRRRDEEEDEGEDDDDERSSRQRRTGDFPSDSDRIITNSMLNMSLEDVYGTDSYIYSPQYKANMAVCEQNIDAYKLAEEEQGVPWQVLAGIHFREGSCNPNQSMASGETLGTVSPDYTSGCNGSETRWNVTPVGGGCAFTTLADSAVYAAHHLRSKIAGKNPHTVQELVKALSYYNGGGNRNCGYTNFQLCPRACIGCDDPYVMSKFSSEYTDMRILYIYDGVRDPNGVLDQRPGTFTASLIMNQLVADDHAQLPVLFTYEQ